MLGAAYTRRGLRAAYSRSSLPAEGFGRVGAGILGAACRRRVSGSLFQELLADGGR